MDNLHITACSIVSITFPYIGIAIQFKIRSHHRGIMVWRRIHGQNEGHDRVATISCSTHKIMVKDVCSSFLNGLIELALRGHIGSYVVEVVIRQRMALADFIVKRNMVLLIHISDSDARFVLNDGAPTSSSTHTRCKIERKLIPIGGNKIGNGAMLRKDIQHGIRIKIVTRKDIQMGRGGEVELLKKNSDGLPVCAGECMEDVFTRSEIPQLAAGIIYTVHLITTHNSSAIRKVHRHVGQAVDSGTVTLFDDAGIENGSLADF